MPDHADEFDDVPMLAARLGVENGLRASRQEGPVSIVRWTGDDPEFVFLHGVGNDARSFDGLALALGRPALAVDLPGHGRSAWRDDADYSPAVIADAVVDAIRPLLPRPIVLVGHSLGSMVATRVAAVAPELVARLVLVDMTPDFADRSLERTIAGLADEPAFDDAAEWIAHAAAVRPGEPLETLAAEARHSFLDGVRRHHFAHLAPGQRATLGSFSTLWPDLEAVAAPVLLVRGERGYVSPRLAAAFAARLPGARVATLPTRHGVHTTDPVGLAAVVDEWITSTPGADAAT
jgi:pimeloyl-ACP methyl ester carboxylesterase